ncbi:MAG: hypothetical protein RQ743_12365 [Bacteroidales bacterium]|nr:hypothetical protein [Bacteroidales bacterium]
MEDLKMYIKDTLGVDVDIKAIHPDKRKALPLYIKSEYNIFRVKLFRQDLIFAEVKGGFTTEKLRKNIETINKIFNTNTVAIIRQLEAYTRKRLVEKKIPFIIPGKQMYMPDLLIDLKEFGVRPKVQPKAMTPATQLLVLYHLQKEPLEEMNFKSLAEKFNYDQATITRSAYYLHNMEICTLKGTKEKSLHFNLDKRELWDKVEPLMSSPVKRTQYFSGWIGEMDLYRTNNNALAHYTDVNDDVVDFYAVRPGYFKFIGGVNLRKAAFLEGNICIEEWKYDPFYLAESEFVDPLSVYLCFRNKPDERIEMALEQIIGNIKW